MKKTILVFFLLGCAWANNVSAAALGDVRVDVTLLEDVATIVWTLPCTKNDSNKAVLTYSIEEYGAMKSDVTFLSATADGLNPFMLESNPGEQNATIFCGTGASKATFTYSTKSNLKGSGVIINFPVFFNTDTFDSVDVFVKVPSNMTLLSASQPYKTISGSAVFHFQDIREADIYESRDLFLLFAKSPAPRGYEFKKIGPYNIYGQSRSVRILEQIEPYVKELDAFYKKILGLSLENTSIHLFVTDLSLVDTEYEASASALARSSLILVDSESLATLEPVDLIKLMVHETTHILVGTSGIFSNQPIDIPWFDEGIAVFSELYFVDSVLNKDEDGKAKNETLSGYQKFSTTTLDKEYKREFDVYFSDPDRISDTYSHAGLIFYKAFLDDPVIIKNLILQLKNEITYEYCESCGAEKALRLFVSLTGLSDKDTFYPFKDSMQIAEKYKVLFKAYVAEGVAKKIKIDAAKNVATYFASSTKPLPTKEVAVKREVPVAVSTSTPSVVATNTPSIKVINLATSTLLEVPAIPVKEKVTEPLWLKVFFAPARLIQEARILFFN